MVLRGDPEDNPHGEFAEHSSLRKKAMVARDKGAAGILFVSGVTFDENDDLIELYYDQSQTGSGIPVLHIKRSVADVLLRKKNYTILYKLNHLQLKNILFSNICFLSFFLESRQN